MFRNSHVHNVHQNNMSQVSFISSSGLSLKSTTTTTIYNNINTTTIQRGPRWICHASKRSINNQNKPRNDNKKNGKKKRQKPQQQQQRSIPQDEQQLTSLFDESEVSKPLLQNEEEDIEIETARKKILYKPSRSERQRFTKNTQTVPLSKALKTALPKSREQTIELLVRGAWAGIAILVGLFISVHLFIVGDWVGK